MSAPLRLYHARVAPEWLDANGHLNDGFYAVAFSYATWEVQDHLGMDPEYRERTGCTLYTAESHLVYLRELLEGQPIRVESLILGSDAKRLHLFHRMYAGDPGHPAATNELMLLHYDQRAGRVAPFPGPVRATLEALARAHAALAWPEEAGRAVRRVPSPG